MVEPKDTAAAGGEQGLAKLSRQERENIRAKRRWQEHAEKGLCGYCDRPAAPGKKRCQYHIDRQNNYQRERRLGAPRERIDAINAQRLVWRNQHKAAGLCTHCNRKAKEGCTLCEYHTKMQELKRKKLHVDGACRTCRKPRPPGKGLCKDCRRKKNDRLRQKKVRRQAVGLCQYCGMRPPFRNRAGCEECLNHLADLSLERRHIRVAEGICTICGKGPHLPTAIVCLDCYWKQTSTWAFGNNRSAGDLKRLFEEAGGRCAYTGRILTPGLDAVLDHKVPESRGGKTELANLQWVHTTVNQMKFNFMEEDFLTLVEDIYHHSCKDSAS